MLLLARLPVLLRNSFALGATLLVAGPALAQVVADAGDDVTVDCTLDSAAFVTLDGLGSTVNGASAALDPNTDFLWTATGIDFSDETSPTPSAEFPLGTTTVTLTVTFTDPVTLIATAVQDTVDVIVEDTTPPTLTVVGDPPSVWPPNHKLVDVDVIAIVSDACDPDPDVVLTSLTSSEPDNGTGDGDTTDDIQDEELGTDDRSFSLRAERSGNGDGRTYTAVYTATDASGNFTNALTTILVPHDQGDLKSNKAAKAAAKAAKAAAKAADKAAKQALKDAKKAAKEAAKAAKAAAKGH